MLIFKLKDSVTLCIIKPSQDVPNVFPFCSNGQSTKFLYCFQQTSQDYPKDIKLLIVLNVNDVWNHHTSDVKQLYKNNRLVLLPPKQLATVPFGLSGLSVGTCSWYPSNSRECCNYLLLIVDTWWHSTKCPMYTSFGCVSWLNYRNPPEISLRFHYFNFKLKGLSLQCIVQYQVSHSMNLVFHCAQISNPRNCCIAFFSSPGFV